MRMRKVFANKHKEFKANFSSSGKKNMFFLLFAFLLIIAALIFVVQERFIFFPDKLSCDFKFNFTSPYEELSIPTKDGKMLNGILFKVNKPKGLIFYLHGNA